MSCHEPEELVECYSKSGLSPDFQASKKYNCRNHGIILLMGYPGAGKGSQGKWLAKQLQIPHISTGDLFRAEAGTGSEIGQQMYQYMNLGQIIPPELTFPYLNKEFSKTVYRNGFILDGYPKNLECLEWLRSSCSAWCLEITHAIELYVTRAEAERRLSSRLYCFVCKLQSQPHSVTNCTQCFHKLIPRHDDAPEVIKTRLDSYESSTIELTHIYQSLGIFTQLDGMKSIETVSENILKCISRSPLDGSYLISEPQTLVATPKSSRFHGHLDARDHRTLLKLARMIQHRKPDAHAKVYPITHLLLGPQTSSSEFASVYQDLPNFHKIQDASDEAFLTTRMGDTGFDYEYIQATLETAFSHKDHGIMTELEQDLYSLQYDTNHSMEEFHYEQDSDSSILDWSRLGLKWKELQISNVPTFELHHGFDVPKTSELPNSPPIYLETLMHETNKKGFTVGGWFVFGKADTWAYRCNEFSNEQDRIKVEARLKQQAFDLRSILSKLLPEIPLASNASLERVHAIWKV